MRENPDDILLDTHTLEALATAPLQEAVNDSSRSGHVVVSDVTNTLTEIEAPDESPLKYSSYMLPPEECAEQSEITETNGCVSEEELDTNRGTDRLCIPDDGSMGLEISMAGTNCNPLDTVSFSHKQSVPQHTTDNDIGMDIHQPRISGEFNDGNHTSVSVSLCSSEQVCGQGATSEEASLESLDSELEKNSVGWKLVSKGAPAP